MSFIFHRYGCIKKASERYRPNQYSDDAVVGSFRTVMIGIVVALILAIIACVVVWQWAGHTTDPAMLPFW